MRFRTTRDTIESDRQQILSDFLDFEHLFRSFLSHFGLILDDMVPGRSLGAILGDFERFWSSFWSHFGLILTYFELKSRCIFATRFWSRFVSILESFSGRFGSHFGIILNSKIDVFSRHVSGLDLYRFRSRFGVDLGAKMEPFGSSRALEKRKCDFAKMLVLLELNLCF